MLVLGRLGSTEGRFAQVFAVVVHASLIDKILGNGVRAFLVVFQRSFFQSTTSAAMFFPELEVTSIPYVVLNQFDFFQLWMFGILALGLKYVFKVDLKRALFISYLFWLLKGLLNIGLSVLITNAYL
jgi:hypothetical protein